jgi:uncharacterized protein YndB with AHSA1/START domain
MPDEETKMPDILLELTIIAAPDKVYKALTEQQGLEAWWTTHMIAEPTVGSELAAFFRVGQQVIRMEMCALEPARKVIWGILERVAGWGGSQFTWDLSPVENGTKVLFGYRDLLAAADGNLPGLTYAWAVNLTSLKDYLEKGKGNPRPG